MNSFPWRKYLKHILGKRDRDIRGEIDQQLLHQIVHLIDTCHGISPDTPLNKMTFVVFDTETTGFHPHAGDEVIEMGAVKIINGEIRYDQTFHSYVNPRKEIPEAVTAITGINVDKVRHAPILLEAVKEFLIFIRNVPLVGHCIHFDIQFLNFKLRKTCRRKISNPVIDTLSLASMVHPTMGNYTLDELLDFYHIPNKNRHTALADAIMTAQLFIKLIQKLQQNRIKTLRDLTDEIFHMQRFPS
ncbi:3'-5' exonuclease [Microaerobacter geothermalis]|uniref:3'-5' exonuclease n=1 Tax=Microaerobacter geothermalis TaxID=674972 RepID=UPI001F31E348|nr:exonuclease domain-containing protein [Microaerobacter geothermalis]